MKLLRLASLLATAALAATAAIIPTEYSGPTGWYKEIQGLPGWDGALPTRIFSGYANLTNVKEAMVPPAPTPETPTEMFMHYFLFLAEKEAGPDPLNAPVLVWWNGGPGATSLWGLFVELGPLLTNMESMQKTTSTKDFGRKLSKKAPITVDTSDEEALRRLYKQLKLRYEGPSEGVGSINEDVSDDDIPTLIRNPWAWTKVASILVFENPPPIGFSYCLPQGPSGNATSCGSWNDTRVGIVNAETLKIVFDDHFPMFLNPTTPQKLHFAGESYAGVFIGETTRWLLEKGTRYFGKVLGALESIALGDACLGGDVLCGPAGGVYDSLLFLYGHGQASNEMWEALLKECPEKELRNSSMSARCTTAVNTFNQRVGQYYAYNLYDQCENTPFSSDSVTATRRRGMAPQTAINAAKMAMRLSGKQAIMASPPALRSVGGGAVPPTTTAVPSPVPPMNGYWCDAMIFFQYFDRPDVRTAIHVPLDSAFFNADNGVGMVYYYNSKSVMEPLMTLITNTNSLINKGQQVRVMWYVGDTDPSINSFAVQTAVVKYVKEHGVKHNVVRVQDWSQWLMAKEGTKLPAGYVIGWNPNGAANLTAFPYMSIVTVKGAGHMVAEYKPLSAYTMMSSFIGGTALPGSKFL